MRWKTLVGIMVLNTILLLVGLPVWQMLLADALIYTAWIAVAAWNSVPNRLARQAAHMGWTYCGVERDESGFRDNCFERNGAMVRVSWSLKCVIMIRPVDGMILPDFVAVERFLASEAD
jgi:hypothetical protein